MTFKRSWGVSQLYSRQFCPCLNAQLTIASALGAGQICSINSYFQMVILVGVLVLWVSLEKEATEIMPEWQWIKMRSESDQTWSRLNCGDKEVSECLLLLSYFVTIIQGLI